MIIVCGHLMVEPNDRDAYLAGCVEVARSARAAHGCIDFHLSADPLEPGRINVFEQWAFVEDVEAFRGAGPSDQQQAAVLSANIQQHRIADTISLT